MRKKYSEKIAVAGILCAQALALNFVENLIPTMTFLPPGAKPGLSNIIVMFSAGNLGFSTTMSIVFIKSAFVLVTRGVTACLISLSGGLVSALVVFVLIKFFKDKMGIIGISVIGSLFHNAGQLAASTLITGSLKTLNYAPVLALFGVIAGILTGILLKAVYPVLKKLKNDC